MGTKWATTQKCDAKFASHKKTKYSAMTITTRTIAKGILPRPHDPKPKPKPRATKSKLKPNPTTKKNHKRVVTDDEGSVEDEMSVSDDSVQRVKKRGGKRHRIELSESEEEVEVVDEDVEPPEEDVEEVDDGIAEQGRPDEQEVSSHDLP